LNGQSKVVTYCFWLPVRVSNGLPMHPYFTLLLEGSVNFRAPVYKNIIHTNVVVCCLYTGIKE
jgi:hypothetical protein